MRSVLVFLIILISSNAISQNVVKGSIVDHVGNKLPRVSILETGTNNRTETNNDGYFELTTINDTSYLSFRWIGFKTQSAMVTSDTILNITLTNDYYEARWLTVGTNYDFFNSDVGVQLSNGVDEEPLIHFEDFQDYLLLKLHGQTDLNSNYSFGAEVGANSLRYVGRTTLKYDRQNFDDSKLYLTDFNLTSRIKYIRNTGLIFRTGYQKFNGDGYYGFGLGLEQDGRNFYFGLNSRFYFDYFHHEAYFQIRIPTKNLLSFRTVYNRIDKKNLLSVGLNYSFIRNNNR